MFCYAPDATGSARCHSAIRTPSNGALLLTATHGSRIPRASMQPYQQKVGHDSQFEHPSAPLGDIDVTYQRRSCTNKHKRIPLQVGPPPSRITASGGMLFRFSCIFSNSRPIYDVPIEAKFPANIVASHMSICAGIIPACFPERQTPRRAFAG